MRSDFWNEAASPGEQEVYHTPVYLKGTSTSSTLPVAAAIQTKMYSLMLQLFKMLCVISSEEAVKLHDGNRSQFTNVFHVIANTADGKQKVDVVIERSGFGSGLLDFLE